MTDLSILIPARNEMFLSRTIEDILTNIRGDTEIIAVLDGEWADPEIEDHERVTIIYHPVSIGQRAATNQAARLARGKWLMKVDAHCSFAPGFDLEMLKVIQPDWTMVPIMKNLHAFNWLCPNGHRRYQGPSGPCAECGEPTEMEIVWISKGSPQSTSYCFDTEPHFQYFKEFAKRPEGKGDLTETMSLQGSCFMLSKEKYFDLDICDEGFGSWGSQGIEVAVKTWLSGGRVMVNHNTWYSHLFRTQGGDFGFPYDLSGRQVESAKSRARELFFNGNWERAIHPLSWLVEKFWPVYGWKDEDLAALKEAERKRPTRKDLTAGIIYYTDNRLDPAIMQACQRQLERACLPVVSVSLAPLSFGKNIHLDLERGYLAMFKQILAGLEAIDTDIVFLVEHDVLYHPSHFQFIPPERDLFFYNENVWKVDATTGYALHYDVRQTSGLCAYRDLLIRHYRERVRRTEAKFAELGDCRQYRNWIRAQGFEPGTHGRAERVDDCKAGSWWSDQPNLDIRHGNNLTPSRWRKDEFRNHRSCPNWKEAEFVQPWYGPGEFRKLIER